MKRDIAVVLITQEILSRSLTNLYETTLIVPPYQQSEYFSKEYP